MASALNKQIGRSNDNIFSKQLSIQAKRTLRSGRNDLTRLNIRAESKDPAKIEKTVHFYGFWGSGSLELTKFVSQKRTKLG